MTAQRQTTNPVADAYAAAEAQVRALSRAGNNRAAEWLVDQLDLIRLDIREAQRLPYDARKAAAAQLVKRLQTVVADAPRQFSAPVPGDLLPLKEIARQVGRTREALQRYVRLGRLTACGEDAQGTALYRLADAQALCPPMRPVLTVVPAQAPPVALEPVTGDGSDQMLNVADLARVTGLTKQTIHQWAYRKQVVPQGTDEQGQRLFRLEDVQALQAAMRKSPTRRAKAKTPELNTSAASEPVTPLAVPELAAVAVHLPVPAADMEPAPDATPVALPPVPAAALPWKQQYRNVFVPEPFANGLEVA